MDLVIIAPDRAAMDKLLAVQGLANVPGLFVAEYPGGFASRGPEMIASVDISSKAGDRARVDLKFPPRGPRSLQNLLGITFTRDITIRRDGKLRGVWAETISDQAEFELTAEGSNLRAGSDVDLWLEKKIEPGSAYLVRLHADAAIVDLETNGDEIDADLDSDGVKDPDERAVKRRSGWYTSKLARAVRRAGAASETEGMRGYANNGITVLPYSEVDGMQALRGAPRHEIL